MKVMPGVLGQIGQNVADNLFEIGKSAVAGTAKAVGDIAGESIEQITSAPGQATSQIADSPTRSESAAKKGEREAVDRQRFNEVRAELAQYVQRKQQLDQRIEQDKAQETQQKKVVEKQKRDSWVSRIINRSQTNTEKGRMQE